MSGYATRRAPRWLLAAEIVVILFVLVGIGIAHFGRLSPAEKEAIQLEAGLQQLYEMEADHLARHGRYFAPADPTYRPYLSWIDRYDTEARQESPKVFSVVVRADLDGDGVAGAWRIDESSPAVQRLQED
jgi:hypothetical protein